MTSGRIFDIQRFSIHDGPGIRTTVFLQGCPLRCIWCHNPEGLSARPCLSFRPETCIGCGECARVCPKSAHRTDAGRHILDRDACSTCGACAAVCPTHALEIVGQERTVDEVMTVVLRDKAFYDSSGGGMTLSGGEPAQQPEFSTALCAAARAHGIHCAMETSGFVEWDVLRTLACVVDLFLFDLKETDPARHREFTGVSNERILDNLRMLHDLGAPVILRLPIVPGRNDRPDHFEQIARLAHSLPRLRGVEIMPYHPLGRSKLPRFGMQNPAGALSVADARERLPGWIAQLGSFGLDIPTQGPRSAKLSRIATTFRRERSSAREDRNFHEWMQYQGEAG